MNKEKMKLPTKKQVTKALFDTIYDLEVKDDIIGLNPDPEEYNDLIIYRVLYKEIKVEKKIKKDDYYYKNH